MVSVRLPEEIRFELAFFPFELFDLLLQFGDPSQGIAMATLPISGLLAEFEVLSLEALDFSAEVSDFRRRAATEAINSKEELLGRQTWTSWPFMTNQIHRRWTEGKEVSSRNSGETELANTASAVLYTGISCSSGSILEVSI